MPSARLPSPNAPPLDESRQLIESSMDGILVVASDSLVRFANRAAEIFFGTPLSNLVGRPMPIPLPQPGHITTVSIRCPNGDEGIGEAYAAHTTWQDEPVLVVTVRDLTEIKRTEETLRRNQSQLENALSELKRLHRQVIQYERLGALGQMASGITHDFNNLLMPILGLSEFMLRHTEVLGNVKDSTEMLEMIRAAAIQARDVVRRLHEFYRPREDSHMGPVSLKAAVDDAINLTRPKWNDESRARGIPITVEARMDNLPEITADESALRDVFMNLILNAVDAMPEGGGLAISGSTQDDWACLSFTDTGNGMPEETLRRCMEPFFTTKGKHGTGLGLSIAHGVVRRHLGTMDIQSEIGRGTTVSIRLPRVQKSLPPDARKPAHVSADHPRANVLVVEDDLMSRQILGRYLSINGHSFDTATTADEALQKLANAQFDVVILDRAFHNGRGGQFVRKIKEISPRTRLIAMSGFIDDAEAPDENKLQFDVILPKPITESDLRDAVASLLIRRP